MKKMSECVNVFISNLYGCFSFKVAILTVFAVNYNL